MDKNKQKINNKSDIYSAIAESTSDYICLISPEGNFIYTNASFKQLGYKSDELVGKSGFDYIHPDNFSQLTSLMEEYINAGNINSIKEKQLPLKKLLYFIFPTKSGEWRDIEANVNVITDDSGNIISFLFLARDITELKRAENALKESEKRFSRIVRNIPGVVYQFIMHIDGSFSIPYINERSRDMFKLEPSEINRDALILLNLIHKDWLETFYTTILESARSLKPFDFTMKWLLSGEERWCQAISSPEKLQNGDIIWDGILTDVTESMKDREALAVSEKRFSRMVANVPGVVYQFIIQADGSFSFPYINDRSRDIFKLDPSEIKNNASLLINLIDNDWRDIFAGALLDSTLEMKPLDFTGKWIISGEERWCRAISSPEKLLNGDIIWDGIITDVTESMKDREALIISEKRFGRMVTNIPGIVHQFILRPDFSLEVIYISEGIREILSLDPKNVQKDPRILIDAIHPDHRDSFNKSLKKSIKNLSHLEWEGKVSVYGKEVWIRAIGHLEKQPDGNILWDGVVIDISEQEKLESQLRESEQDINDLINTFNTFVSKLTPDGKIVFSNATSLLEGGLSLEEVTGKFFQDLKWLSYSQADRNFIIDAIKNAGLGISTRHEISFLNKNGKLIPLIADIHPVFDEGDKIKYIIFEGKSIVEEKHLREELISAKENLEEKVRDRTAEITAINEKLIEEIAIRKKIEASLRESEARFRDISFNIGDLIWEVDTLGKVTYISENIYKLSGYKPEDFIGIKSNELMGKTPLSTSIHEQQMIIEIFFQKSNDIEPIYDLETWFTNTKDDKVCMLTNAVPIVDEKNQFTGFRGVSKDITERKKAEEETIRLAAFPRESPNPILSSDEKGEIKYINPTAQRLTEQLGIRLEKQFLPENHKELVRTCLETNRSIKEVEVRIKNHVFLWTYTPVQAINIVHIHGMDISDQKRFEEKLMHDAFHDELTGLPNRALFLDRLGHSIKLARRNKGYLFAVLFLDMDRFKLVNDSLGHIIGDMLLVELSQRLNECIRPGDTIARFGGDEFTILLDNISGTTDAIKVAKRIQSKLSNPIKMQGHEIFSTVSIGIAMSTTGYLHPEDALRDADTAMFHAKAVGISRYVMFDKTMHTNAMKLLEMESDLQHAIERHEFRLHYQPIVSLDNFEIIGFEALLRWQHPKRGLVLPGEFISIIEETGLILPIGQWILHEACGRMSQWIKKTYNKKKIFISVNLSAKQFIQPDLISQIKKILKETNLDPESLKMEITESLIIENYEASAATLEQLRKMKIRLCIDDFGTGYCSLSHLHHFPINTIKVDRTFVNEIGPKGENLEIIRTIINLAHNLGMDVIAEGVETKTQMELLKKNSCEYAQGLLFSRPLEGNDVAEMLKENLILKK